MNFKQFIATRQQADDLRQFPDSPYGANNSDPDSYPDAISGFAYGGGDYAIQQHAEDNGYTVFIQFEQSFRDLLSAELELFYYHGRFVGQTVELNLFERLEMACRTSDLDAACRYVQDGLGVESGDGAGLFFSHCEGSDGPSEHTWPSATLRQRFVWMCDYIRQELNEVDARLTDPDSAAASFVGQPPFVELLA